jgi:hypothetical protein
MKQGNEFTPEERARMIAIGDLLIERYIEQREALEAGDRAHAIELQFEIKELMRERQKVKRLDPRVIRYQTRSCSRLPEPVVDYL